MELIDVIQFELIVSYPSDIDKAKEREECGRLEHRLVSMRTLAFHILS